MNLMKILLEVRMSLNKDSGPYEVSKRIVRSGRYHSKVNDISIT